MKNFKSYKNNLNRPDNCNIINCNCNCDYCSLNHWD